VRNTGQIGILINPAGGGVAGQRIDAAFDNVRVQNSGFGIIIGNNARAMVNRSVFTGNSQAGIFGIGAFAAMEANISNSGNNRMLGNTSFGTDPILIGLR
jgi:hypothetical protein